MREEKIDKIEVHVAGICFAGDKVLMIRRSPSRKIYPKLWECGGGEIKSGENFKEAVTRQMKEELGIIVKPIEALRVYEILTPNLEQKKIPGVRFVCKITEFINGKEPEISNEHSEWRWQSVDKLDELEIIPGIKEDILDAYYRYKSLINNL